MVGEEYQTRVVSTPKPPKKDESRLTLLSLAAILAFVTLIFLFSMTKSYKKK